MKSVTMEERDITVICATYNRAQSLKRMLDALVRQNYNRLKWKLIVVDNNSTDHTQEVLKSYLDKLPLQILFEPKQGKSQAVNQAFGHLEGWLVVTIDDDIEPFDDWLEQMVRVAKEKPEYDIFCGYIEPFWEVQPPEWVLKWPHHGIVFAVNPELEEGEIPPVWVTGGNAAYRRKAMEGLSYGGGELGPSAGNQKFPMGEDVAFSLKIVNRGGKAYYTKDTKVRHCIPSERIEEAWILGRAERYGRGTPYVRPEWFEGKSLFLGMPVTTLVKYVTLKLLHPFIYALPQSKRRYDLLWKLNMSKGILHTMMKVNKGKGLISRFQPVSDFLD
ncbi:MAG: glycosyltransferase [Alphaproteobacteria bacterium]|nr:glycosyltransferase [Alphaproteobacteria bacterium]